PKGPQVNLFLALLAQIMPETLGVDPLEWALNNRQFGDIAYYKFGPMHVYQLNSPDLARQLLLEHPEKFHKPRIIKHAFGRFGGNGLCTSEGALWKQQRRMMQPAFHHGQLAGYGEIMVSHARRMVEGFRDGEVRDIGAEMVQLTLGIVVQALFGADVTQQTG